MTNPPLSAPDELCGRLAELLAKATSLPWEYRPDQYDDWGFIRGAEQDFSFGRAKPIVAIAREGGVDSDHDQHRRDKTDPYEPIGRLIVEAINALPLLLADRTALMARVEEAEWLPIATAPKDGGPLDLWVSTPHTIPPGRRVTDAQWLDGKWREWIEYDDEFDGELDGDPDAQMWFDGVGWTATIETSECPITHWMRPPEPPALLASKGDGAK